MNNIEREIIPKIRNDDKKLLASFYENVEKVKVIEVPRGFNKNPIRPAIMAILRNGIKDKDLNQQRYALNALEIKDLINKDEKLLKKMQQLKKGESSDNLDENSITSEIGYTNLYFHLSKLEEVNAIRKVAYVIEKSHKIAYYGRTARFILPTDSSYEQKYYKETFGEFGKFMKVIDPEVKLEDFHQIGEEYYKIKTQRVKILTMILANNEQILMKDHIDTNKVFSCLKIIDSHYPEYKTILQTLSEKLNKLT